MDSVVFQRLTCLLPDFCPSLMSITLWVLGCWNLKHLCCVFNPVPETRGSGSKSATDDPHSMDPFDPHSEMTWILVLLDRILHWVLNEETKLEIQFSLLKCKPDDSTMRKIRQKPFEHISKAHCLVVKILKYFLSTGDSSFASSPDVPLLPSDGWPSPGIFWAATRSSHKNVNTWHLAQQEALDLPWNDWLGSHSRVQIF